MLEGFMMDNKTCSKTTYKCAICGEAYETVSKRMNCEQECLKKQAEEEKKAEELKKEIEYAARKAEVDMAYEKYIELRNKFAKDYGSYEYRTVSNTFGKSERYLPFSLMW
jgi:uncharacterized protein with HEPN domain